MLMTSKLMSGFPFSLKVAVGRWHPFLFTVTACRSRILSLFVLLFCILFPGSGRRFGTVVDGWQWDVRQGGYKRSVLLG